MKSFHDFLGQLISAQERYSKDLDSAVKKAATPSIHTTLSNSYNDTKETFSQISKQHHTAVTTLKEINSELDKSIKDLKTSKTKLHDNYQKVLKDMESKKQTHIKTKMSYEEAVKKAENAVMAFRQGCSTNAGNDKAIRKLEDAVTSATKDLDRAHAAYLKAVRDCQASQSKFEQETAVMLSQFEEIERRRLQLYQELLQRFTDAQQSVQTLYTEATAMLATSVSKIAVEADIETFIVDTYTGNPPEPHAAYEPRNTEIIPHYGDQNAIAESQAHQVQQQGIHAHMMRNSHNAPMTHALGNNAPVAAPPAAAAAVASPPPQSMNAFLGGEEPAPVPVVPLDNQPTGRALYDFAGQEEGDLSFAAGDLITLVSHDPAEEWWHGSLNGSVGTFPRDYVERVDQAASTTAPPPFEAAPAAVPVFSPEPAAVPPPMPAAAVPAGLKAARALYPFEGVSDDELSFGAGDTLYVATEIDGWYEGEDVNGRKGIFPANYVELV
jgi:hypothetical protein